MKKLIGRFALFLLKKSGGVHKDMTLELLRNTEVHKVETDGLDKTTYVASGVDRR